MLIPARADRLGETIYPRTCSLLSSNGSSRNNPFAMRNRLYVISAVAWLLSLPLLHASPVQVILEDHHDVSLPLSAMAPFPASVPTADSLTNSVVSGNFVFQMNFNGVGYSGMSGSPPDANGAAGDTQYVQWVNSDLGVFSKSTGTLELGPVQANSIWNGFGGPCQNTNGVDGIVLYDKIAARWVISRHAKNSNTGAWYQCVAVSTSSDATGSYHRYAFLLPNKNYPDYPKMGVWPDAYYLSMNQLSNNNFSFLGAEVCALKRAAMLTGASATMQCFQLSASHGETLLPADLDGTTLPPSGSPNFMMNLLPGVLQLWRFHVDFQTPSNSNLIGPTKLSPASFTTACNGSLIYGTGGFCIPQQKTSQVLDSLSEEGLMYRLAYRNFGTHDSIVVTHSVGSAPTGIRWYEIRNLGTSPTIYQQGTYKPNATFRWMGSAAMDKLGNIAIGYSLSSSSMYPGIAITGRLSSDLLGTLEAEQSIIQGSGSQTRTGRWGDYTSMSVDPTDDCTFWYTNEYLKSSGNNNWSTRIASFRFSSCQ